MSLAFNTVLYSPGRLADALEEISAAGYQGIELQPHLTLPLLGSATEDRTELAAALGSHGLRLAATMSGYLRDPATLATNIAAAELARDLGGGWIILLPPQPWMCSRADFDALLVDLAAACEPLGVRIAVHHHAGTILDTPAAIDEFAARRADDRIRLCFDLAHYALFADDEVAAAARLAPAIGYVHVKDLSRRHGELDFVPGVRNAQQSFRVFGDGVLELEEALRALRDGGFDGWWSVEVENFYRSRIESAERSRAAAERAIG
jgi:sugar phosphate isomerase/epimerase